MDAIVTMPPYAPYLCEVLAHPVVSGIRLNTVMPVHEPLEEAVKRLAGEAADKGKELWVDLKGRQLRIKTYGVPPFTEIELTHAISVESGATAYFGGGERATVLSVKGNRLIMQEGPRRVVGPGEAINIPHGSLKIEGYLTESDKRYIDACVKVGVHSYMASFVEGPEDIAAILQLDPNAMLTAKIESLKGLDYAEKAWKGEARLMTARGDLYVEVRKPHHILQASEMIVQKDPSAIAASRILDSLAHSLEPSCADLGDVDNLLRMGYKTLMLGDEVCMQRDSVISALNVLRAVAERYKK